MSALHVIAGNSVSVTVTSKEQELVFPAASVTVNVCVVVPAGNKDPLGKPAVCVVIAPAQLSVPTGGVKATTAPHWPASLFTLIFGLQLITGNSVSVTVTSKEQEAVFPEASVTVNVCVVVPIGNIAPLARPAVCVVVTPVQLSVPAGGVKVTTAPHCPASLFTAMFELQTIAGNSVSVTVTSKEQETALPEASVTVNVSVVIPIGNKAPLANPAVCVVVAPAQLSVPAGGVKLTMAPHCPASLTVAIFALHVITGISLSVTVIVNEQVAVLPEGSVAVNVCVVVPIGNIAPLANPAVCTIDKVQLSVATGAV